MSEPARKVSHSEVLNGLVRAHNWRAGAEIGVLNATTSMHLLAMNPKLRMVCVDQWQRLPPRDVEGAETYDHRDMPAAEAIARRRLMAFGRRAQVLKGDSATVVCWVEDGSLDFVFIDADHTEAGFRRDFMAWLPKVRAGGYVCGHDWSWPTVDRVLRELAPSARRLFADVWAVPKDEVPPCA